MSKGILLVIESVSSEKGIPAGVILEALELALTTATKKHSEDEADLYVEINHHNSSYEAFRRWHAVADRDYQDPVTEITVGDTQEQKPSTKVGEVVEEKIEPIRFGRIAAQTVKQAIVQKVREVGRAQMIDAYREEAGEVVSSTVKEVTRDSAIVGLGSNAEMLLACDQITPCEALRVSAHMRTLLGKIRIENCGSQLVLSRIMPEMLIELSRVEVPETAEQLTNVMAAVRDPSPRTKIAVRSKDKHIDPQGACIDMCGSRVQAVSGEIGGERVDVVLQGGNPAQFVINATAPAEVAAIIVDEDTHATDIVVAEDNPAQAVGRGDQNTRPASRLTDWTLNVMAEAGIQAKQQAKTKDILQRFVGGLDVDEELAQMPVEKGLTTPGGIAYVPMKEMFSIDDFGKDAVSELCFHARDRLLTEAIATEEKLADAQLIEDLLSLDGMSKELVLGLTLRGVTTREDLAKQSIDGLLDIDGMGEERAGKLIITVQAHWFE